MQTLPWIAQLYIQGAYLGGIAALLAAFLTPFPIDLQAQAWEYATFILIGGGLGWKTIQILPGSQRSGSSIVSLGFIIIFASMLRFGILGTVLTGIASALVGSIKARHLWYQILFNVSISAIQSFLASLAFLSLNQHQVTLHLPDSLPALVASSLIFFLVNSSSVALVIALCSKKNVFQLWNENFLWTAPGYFAGAAVSVLAIGIMGGAIPATLLCLAPVVYITYLSFKKFTDRTEALAESQEQLSKLYLSTTRSLALAIDAKDRYTHQHIIRVQRYALAIARKAGIKGDELQAIEVGALLHDIGKLGIPEDVLLKPGRLTAEEFDKIKEHPRIGAEILEPVPFPWPVLPAVKHHHERWDGTGYPDGLRGEDIPLIARILAVADVYDALTSVRSYRGAWTHERACNEIKAQSGRQFDPAVVETFLSVIDSVIAIDPLPDVVPLPEPPQPNVTIIPIPATARNEEQALAIVIKDTAKPIFAGRAESVAP